MELWEDVQRRISDLADRLGNSVVGIRGGWSHGTGVVLAPGKVLTNAHNVARGDVEVVFADGRRETARVGGADFDGDIAVLEVETGDAPVMEWAETNGSVGIGTPVFALANPGGRGLRVTFGFVSGTQRAFRGPRGRRIRGGIEHTAPLLPGSSGGPIVDPTGRMFGVNTNRLGEGFCLALPADVELRGRVDRLARGESKDRARLGIAVAPPELARRMRRAVGLDEIDGLLVRGVEEGPAGRAGIREGDLIVEVAGRPLESVDALYAVLDEADGTELELKVVRGSETRAVKVALG
ncbi:MAG TPA: trypsin-like peptidase domain-containing protein [Actinomycetota bacterium]|nr:trypsin-like peptidase domain-containing protein [Actinomycetota bacterium]